MPINRLALRDQQSHFYRNAYRRLLNFAIFLAFLNLAMVAYIIYKQMTRPTPLYFATTLEGRLVQIPPIAPP